MAGEGIFIILMFVSFMFLAYFLSRNNKPREMTTIEREEYERERGRRMAQEEFTRNR